MKEEGGHNKNPSSLNDYRTRGTEQRNCVGKQTASKQNFYPKEKTKRGRERPCNRSVNRRGQAKEELEGDNGCAWGQGAFLGGYYTGGAFTRPSKESQSL